MAERYYRVICAMSVDTALPGDVVTNTWHFRHENTDFNVTPQDSANDMVDQLENFYQAIDQTLFPSTVGTVIQARAYDLNDAEPRVPVLIRDIAITPSGTTPLPHEVAVTMSLKSDVSSGQIAARRRGRVYLGPVAASVVTVEGGRVTVGLNARETIRDAAVNAFGTANGGPLIPEDPKLHIYSRTTDLNGGTIPDSFFRVNSVEVDNAFDTIRSRGHDATTKTVLRITN